MNISSLYNRGGGGVSVMLPELRPPAAAVQHRCGGTELLQGECHVCVHVTNNFIPHVFVVKYNLLMAAASGR